MRKIIYLILFLTINFAFANEDAEKEKWIAETEKNNLETLKKIDSKWVNGCVSATTIYIGKNRKIKDGLTPKFNAQNVCALISSDDDVKAHLKSGKDLKFKGCVDGIAMSMQMFDKSATNQKRKEIIAEYCL